MSLALKVALVALAMVSCGPSTENPTEPGADDPFVLGAPSMVPWGCLLWRDQQQTQQKCCPLIEDEEGNWSLESFDC